MREIPDDAAIQLAYAQKVIVVPGYGLAVAQAQHAVRELAELLEARGVEVEYAIHPVAGRMPGHMNVLLAEANVPYPQLKEMDDINPEFQRADVALVVGANDVTNPAARTNTSSPISGMPILNVDEAKSIIVIKRSMGRGYAGIDNEPTRTQDRDALRRRQGRPQALVTAVKAIFTFPLPLIDPNRSRRATNERWSRSSSSPCERTSGTRLTRDSAMTTASSPRSMWKSVGTVTEGPAFAADREQRRPVLGRETHTHHVVDR